MLKKEFYDELEKIKNEWRLAWELEQTYHYYFVLTHFVWDKEKDEVVVETDSYCTYPSGIDNCYTLFFDDGVVKLYCDSTNNISPLDDIFGFIRSNNIKYEYRSIES